MCWPRRANSYNVRNQHRANLGKEWLELFGRRRWTELDHLRTTPLRHTNAYAIIRRRGGEHRGRAGNHASDHRDYGVSEEWRDARSDRRDG